MSIAFSNSGAQTAVFQVRSANPLQAPRSYTVGPGATLTDTWQFAAAGLAAYDLSVYGPNGFFRHYRGAAAEVGASNLVCGVVYYASAREIDLQINNAGIAAATVQLKNVYSGAVTTHAIAAGATLDVIVSIKDFAGWYDCILTVASDATFQQEIAGHLETGQPSTTDPAIS